MFVFIQPKYDLRLVRVSLEDEDTPETPPTEEEIVIKNRLKEVEILDASKRLETEELGLDGSQAAAFYAALTQKVTVIQGPPGTGKTYLGLRIVQTLLHNSQYWSPGLERSPILVICYTNHALDQFLE